MPSARDALSENMKPKPKKTINHYKKIITDWLKTPLCYNR